MRVSTLLAPLVLAASTYAALSRGDAVDISVAFPKNNPFRTVQNGVSTNALSLQLANHAGEDIIITGVRGEFREVGGKERIVRKTTALALKQPVKSGLKSPAIPYKFHSENKIGEIGLRVFLEYTDSGNKKHTVKAFDDVVSVVEPPTSWFDLQLLSVYAIVASLLYGAFRLVESLYLSPSASQSSSKSSKFSKSGGKSKSVVATSDIIDGTQAEVVKGLDEDWIPAHHRKSVPGKGKGKKAQ